MGLFSFITLVALKINQIKILVGAETASWYNKKSDLTFSDVLAVVRRDIWSKKYFSKSENRIDFDKSPDEIISSLIYQLSSAA